MFIYLMFSIHSMTLNTVHFLLCVLTVSTCIWLDIRPFVLSLEEKAQVLPLTLKMVPLSQHGQHQDTETEATK